MNMVGLSRGDFNDLEVCFDLHYVGLSGPGLPVQPTRLVDKRMVLFLSFTNLQVNQIIKPYASSLIALLQQRQGLYAKQKRHWILPLHTCKMR